MIGLHSKVSSPILCLFIMKHKSDKISQTQQISFKSSDFIKPVEWDHQNIIVKGFRNKRAYYAMCVVRFNSRSSYIFSHYHVRLFTGSRLLTNTWLTLYISPYGFSFPCRCHLLPHLLNLYVSIGSSQVPPLWQPGTEREKRGKLVFYFRWAQFVTWTISLFCPLSP